MRKHNRCFCCGRRCCRFNRAENEYEPNCCGTSCLDCCDGKGIKDKWEPCECCFEMGTKGENTRLLAAYEGSAAYEGAAKA
jgi:hypothetical protein